MKNILTACFIFFIYINNSVAQDLKISGEHPQYWEYKGNPILFLGGSVEDNLCELPCAKSAGRQ